MSKKILVFIKKETVLCVAVVLALISMIFNSPGKEYIDFIDYRVLGILLSLMLVISGLQNNGVFVKLGGMLIEKCSDTRKLVATLIFMCFFASMFLTNDVSLITFVPFAILTLKMGGKEKLIISTVVMQTIAANMGSMLTPMGNPHNLYLYAAGEMEMLSFMKLTLPYTIFSGILLALYVFVIKKEELSLIKEEKEYAMNKKEIIIYSMLFILSLLSVVKVISWIVATVIIVVVVAIVDFKVFKRADYTLLFTFVAFFIFIGNIKEMEAVREALSNLISGREFLMSLGLSQVVSNVPASILLSGFTDNFRALVVGANLGGLGTLIASMASLISYKLFVNEYADKKGKYFLVFTVMNVVFLGLMVLSSFVFKY